MILMASPAATIIIFSFLISTLSFSQSSLVDYACGTSGNYTSNSIYNTNLDSALANLYSTANTSNSGFYDASVGKDVDRVNVLVLCRVDVQPDICRSCVKDSVDKLRKLCPNQKEAVEWYDECMLRYSNNSIVNNLVKEPAREFLINATNATDTLQFSKDLRALLDDVREQAIRRKFATGNRSTGPDHTTIYALMQCTPDLSLNDCHDCLDKAIENIPDGIIGAQYLKPSCRLRFEIARFYNETTMVDAPSPQPQLPPPLSSAPSQGKDNIMQIVSIIVVVIVVFVILLLILVCIFKKKSKQRTDTATLPNDNVEDIRSSDSLQYDFDTIEVATKYFSPSNKLGQGGFGAVYKGTLKSGQEVAVKRLSRGSDQGEEEFKNEVLLVAQLQHRNLVRLLGFCYEGTERLLIYEFVPNASLDHFIFADSTKRSFLDWEIRYKIIGGVARGLLYLHEDSRLRIVHRDLKPSNVLLDAGMNPKISDFGMARLFGMDETQGNTSRVVGTYGYMAPEYAMYGEFSVRSDVFSFGVLVLEIVSGQKNNCFRNGKNVQDLTSAAWKNWQQGNASNVIDPLLLKNSSETISEMIRCIHIGLLCVQENVEERPTMASVVLMLNSFSLILALPSQPAFLMRSSRGSRVNDISSTSKEKSMTTDSSIDLASITDLYPR